MIVAIAVLLVQAAAATGPCVAWRDPDGGKILDARGVKDREAALRRRVFSTASANDAPLSDVRAPLICVRHAGEGAAAGKSR